MLLWHWIELTNMFTDEQKWGISWPRSKRVTRCKESIIGRGATC